MSNSEHADPRPLPGAGDGEQGRRPQLLRAAFIAVGALAIAGIIYAMAGTLGTTDSQRPRGGNDSRIALEPGLSAVVQTEAKAVVQARVRTVARDGSGFTATVTGMPEGEAGAWTAILDDGSAIPIEATIGDSRLVTISLAGAVPEGRTLYEVRLDPDASAGDIYFETDAKPGD